MAKNIQYILWKPLYKVTLFIYFLIIIFWILSPGIATLLLFALISLWSRVPAMTSNFTKDVEILDFFTVMIAINLGGIAGGIFGFTIMLISRFFGPVEEIDYTIKDAVCFLFGGMLVPVFYSMTGENTLLTMYVFTLIGRYGIYMLLDLLVTPGLIFRDLLLIAFGVPIAYFSNTLLVSIFGNFLDNLFDEGLKMNITLFIFVTIVILGFFTLGYFLAKRRNDNLHVIEREYKYSKINFMSDPHAIFLSYFDIHALPDVISGSFKHFRFKALFMAFVLMVVVLFMGRHIPTWYEIIFITIGLFITINIIIFVFHRFFGTKEAKLHLKH